jgi:hypothetical protein
MKIEWLRASSYKSYKDCEFRYFLNHDVGIESKAGKKANLGTISHWVLEKMAKAKKAGTHTKHNRMLDVDFLLDVAWNHYTGLYEDHEYEPADKKFCRQQIDSVLDTPYHPFDMNILGVEKQFELKIDRPGFENFGIRGTIDLITERSPEVLEVVDYKTGERKDWITGEEINETTLINDIQFRIYDLAVRRMYPGYKHYEYTMFFTREGGPFTVTFTDEDRKKTWDIIYNAQRDIRHNEAPKRLQDNSARGMERWKCKYVCQFGKTYAVLAENLADAGDIILEYQPKGAAVNQILERNGKAYIVTDVYTQCDYFHAFQPYNKTSAKLASELISLTVKGDTISARNDYNNPKIFKGSIS